MLREFQDDFAGFHPCNTRRRANVVSASRPFHLPAPLTNVRVNFWRVSGLRWQNPDAAKLKELSSVTRIFARIQNPEQI